MKLFEALDVPTVKSNMSFGVSANGGAVEYALNDLRALFAQPSNICRPDFYRMIRDVYRFNKHALATSAGTGWTMGELMDHMRLGDWFRRYYILPFSGAIWSSSLEKMMHYPAEALLRFFDNHHLLDVFGQHQWYTVDGGSIEYVNRLSTSLSQQGCDVRLNAPIVGVERCGDQVRVRARGGEWETFDRVVFACHSDQALAMLSDATSDEQRLLGAIKYQHNSSVLHCDPNIMPRRKACWASWVYSDDEQKFERPVGVTYWMNSLQPIPHDDLLLQSLNPARPIRDDLIYEEHSFMHPVFDAGALQAQKDIQKIQGDNNTWFCGAYLRNGFHEDGYSSAVDVAEMMGMIPTWA